MRLHLDYRFLFFYFPIMFRTSPFKPAARLRSYAKWPTGARNFNATMRRKAEVQLTIDGKHVSIEGTA